MADPRAVKQLFDCFFNLCGTEFAIIGFDVNSMGARFNPVSVLIVNSESSEACKAAFVDQRDEGPQKLHIAKPSIDNSSAFIKFAKKEFGKHADIQQCCVHFTGNLLIHLFQSLFLVFD
jgi:hypothetical protein